MTVSNREPSEKKVAHWRFLGETPKPRNEETRHEEGERAYVEGSRV